MDTHWLLDRKRLRHIAQSLTRLTSREGFPPGKFTVSPDGTHLCYTTDVRGVTTKTGVAVSETEDHINLHLPRRTIVGIPKKGLLNTPGAMLFH